MKVYLFQSLLFTFALLTPYCSVQGSGFCYDENNLDCGPNSWPEPCQSGTSQSPIDLPHWKSPSNQPYPIIYFDPAYKNGCPKGYITNNGHTAQLSCAQDATSQMAVQTSLFPGYRFLLGQMHCHWPSEHTLATERYPLECHCVHYNDQYPNIGAAVASNDPIPLLIIGMLFKNMSTGGQPMSDNSAMAPFTDSMENIIRPNGGTMETGPVNFYNLTLQSATTVAMDSKELPIFNLGKTVKTNNLDVYSYNGSLTTPSCNERMHWLFLKNPLSISNQQLEKFYNLKNGENEDMTGNYRPTQNLYERTVTQYRCSVP